MQGIETPAIIVVGKVCALADQFAWYESLPLAGKKILVTRPRQLISAMAEKLRWMGAEVLELPAIRTEPILPNERLTECLNNLERYDWVVFTSPTGVQVFFDELKRRKKDVRALACARLAVIGNGTAKALEQQGLFADLMPEIYDGKALGKALADQVRPGEWVLIPRASLGNRELTEALAKAPDIVVEDVATYDTFYESQSLIDEKAEFTEGKIDYAVFTSASTVRGFAQALEGMDFAKVSAVCIGKQTQKAAKEYGMQTFVAEKATMDSVVEKLCQLCGQ